MCGADIEQTIRDLMPEGPSDWYLGKLISMLLYLGTINWSRTASFENDQIDWDLVKERAVGCIDKYIVQLKNDQNPFLKLRVKGESVQN